MAAGLHAVCKSVREASITFRLKEHVVKYWKRKFLDPSFHDDYVGGARNEKWNITTKRLIDCLLLASARVNPQWRLNEHRLYLSGVGYEVTNQFIGNKFKDFGLSFKVPVVFHAKRYSDENYSRYIAYFQYVRTLNPNRLKFIDECSCLSRQLRRRVMLGQIGEPVFDINPDHLDKTISVLLMSTLTKPNHELPLVFQLREGTNKDNDFFNFLIYLLDRQHLTSGDILFVDNAAIHNSFEILQDLVDILNGHGVQYVFLPPYSPDTNPCEKVFAGLKHYLRWRRGSSKFAEEIIKGLCTTTKSHMEAYYKDCLHTE